MSHIICIIDDQNHVSKFFITGNSKVKNSHGKAISMTINTPILFELMTNIYSEFLKVTC